MKTAAWLVLVAAIGLVAGRPPDVSPDGNLVDAALDAAEGKLANIPNAPRLTRGELRALVDDAVTRRNKSLLVVLPVPASGAPLEELYTVKPVTQLVGDGTTTTPSSSSRKPIKRRRKPPPRPVYVSTTQSTSTVESVTRRTSTEYVPKRTSATTKRTTTEKDWAPLSELAVPEGFREPLDGLAVATTHRIFVTPPKTAKPLPTTESSLPPADVAVAAQSLTPEMKELLATFGLLGPEAAAAVEAQKIPSTTEVVDPLLEAAKPEVDPAAYLTFKPLPPAAGEMTPDMRGFLASFGLLPDDKPLPPKRAKKVTREERRLKPQVLAEAPQVDTDILPESMASVLADLGLVGDSAKMSSRSGREHVFSPAGGLDASREAAAERLVARLRALAKDKDPFSLTTAHLRDALGEDAALLDGPDPINLTELLNLADAEGDNLGGEDFKRQQPDLGGLEVMDQTSSSENVESTEEPSAAGEENTSDADTTATSSASGSASAASSSSGSSATASASSLSSSSSGDSSAAAATTSNDDSSASAASSASNDESSAAAAASGDGSSSAASASSDGMSSSAAASSSDGASSAAAASSSDDSSSAAAASASSDGSSSAAAASADSGGSRTTEGPSIQDLEDSFGGEITTTPRPNGLYFLLDWNSFLQVGQDERKVDLSFNPKIGDARNFYPIKFP